MISTNWRGKILDKRYQVFISSTYSDLIDERKEVMQVLLEMDAIPAGMELFPAADDDQWTLIKKVIDASDYYLVIVGGRYGSVGPEGISYTEMEFRYAKEIGKPILGFVHKEPGKISSEFSEASPEGKAKLDDFRNFVKGKHCRFYTSASELGGLVSRGLVAQIKSKPGIGWVRGDQVADENATKEILALRHRVEELESEIEATRVTAPVSAQGLADGDATVNLNYIFSACVIGLEYQDEEFEGCRRFTWNKIFASVAPSMIDDAPESAIITSINSMISGVASVELRETDPRFKFKILSDFKVKRDDFNTIKVQLRALGLIVKSTRNRSVSDTRTYWTLTPYGDNMMTQLLAIRKPVDS